MNLQVTRYLKFINEKLKNNIISTSKLHDC